MDPMDREWHPRILAAAVDGGASGGDGVGRGNGHNDDSDQPDSHQSHPDERADTGPALPTSPKPRRRRRSKATPGHAGNWHIRGAVQRQRLAQWFAWTRTTRLHMSLRELQRAAHADDVSLSVAAIQRIESLVDPALASERSWIAFDYVLWLAAYSGQSLADLDRFLNSGDWRNVGDVTDEAPSAESLADRVRVRFLALSPERRRAVIDFIEHERYLDELDLQASLGLRSVSPSPPPPARPQPSQQEQRPEWSDAQSDAQSNAMTQQVLDDLAQGQEATREATRQHERRHQQRPGHTQQTSQVSQVSDERESEQPGQQRQQR